MNVRPNLSLNADVPGAALRARTEPPVSLAVRPRQVQGAQVRRKLELCESYRPSCEGFSAVFLLARRIENACSCAVRSR